MQLIAQPPLFWAPERIYSAPDLSAHTTWLQAHFPGVLDGASARAAAPHLGKGGRAKSWAGCAQCNEEARRIAKKDEMGVGRHKHEQTRSKSES